MELYDRTNAICDKHGLRPVKPLSWFRKYLNYCKLARLTRGSDMEVW